MNKFQGVVFPSFLGFPLLFASLFSCRSLDYMLIYLLKCTNRSSPLSFLLQVCWGLDDISHIIAPNTMPCKYKVLKRGLLSEQLSGWMNGRMKTVVMCLRSHRENRVKRGQNRSFFLQVWRQPDAAQLNSKILRWKSSNKWHQRTKFRSFARLLFCGWHLANSIFGIPFPYRIEVWWSLKSKQPKKMLSNCKCSVCAILQS